MTEHWKEGDFQYRIREVQAKLPIPSECPGDLNIPMLDDDGMLRQVVFTKDIHDGIVIGWRLKETK
jgi:hypothetical protein